MADDMPTGGDVGATRNDLAAVMERFGAGDLEARATGTDELSLAFNRMAARLQEEIAAVRHAVAARQSELLNYQQELARAERLAALGALAAKLAHELGTPLHSIAGHLDLMLADPALPPVIAERARIVAGEVDRLSGMIRRLLRQLRVPQPEVEPTDINELLRRIVRVLEPLLDVRGIEVETDLAADAATPFPCDPRQIEQVIMNLVQNALDSMPDGGLLIVRTSVTSSGRSISVADTGLGVPPDVIGRVFEPFFTTKQAGQGTGLGLPLCREIARSHGGDIILDSKLGLGTVVTLTLGVPRA